MFNTFKWHDTTQFDFEDDYMHRLSILDSLYVNNSPIQDDTSGWGGPPYKSDRDCRKIQIKSLSETNVGVAQA